MQVGTTLVRSLRDPSPHVRNHAKAALDTMRTQQEAYWEQLIQDPQGPAAKDPKLKKWLLAQGGDVDVSVAEDLSVASRFSYNSDTRFAVAARGPSTPSFLRASPRRGLTQQYNNHQHSNIRRTRSTESTSDEEEARVPLSIAVKKTAPPAQRSSRLGPPLRPKPVVTTTAEPSFEGTPPRVPTATTHAPQPLEPIVDYSHTEGEDPLVPTTTTEAVPSPRFPANLMGGFADMSLQEQEQDEPDIATSPTAAEADVAPVSSDKEEENQQPTEKPQMEEGEDYQPPTTIVSSSPPKKEESSKTESSPIAEKDSNANASPLTTSAAAAKRSPSPVTKRSPSDGPFSVSMQKLKEHAMKRRSRNSMLMQQRLRMSSSGLSSSVHLEDDDSDENDNDDDAHKKRRAQRQACH